MNQVEIDYKRMIAASEFICRFCDTFNNKEECLKCGVNRTIHKYWNKLSDIEKERCDCPWSGIQSV